MPGPQVYRGPGVAFAKGLGTYAWQCARKAGKYTTGCVRVALRAWLRKGDLSDSGTRSYVWGVHGVPFAGLSGMELAVVSDQRSSYIASQAGLRLGGVMAVRRWGAGRVQNLVLPEAFCYITEFTKGRAERHLSTRKEPAEPKSER